MEFAFTPEQVEFRRSVAAFCEREIVPVAGECDARGEFPLHLFTTLGRLGWLGALDGASVGEAEADAYIARAVTRDPDLWVVEIEDRAGRHPFEGKVL